MSASPAPDEPPPPEVPKSSLARLFKNASIYGAGQFVTTIIGFVTGPILSYLLTRADFASR